jgi:dTMP kinase
MIVTTKELQINSPSFIVFEGGNGVGKSTLMTLLATHLRQKGKHVVTTREPGGTPLGTEIRSLVKERRDIAIDELTELFLFCADRAQHIKECIEPNINLGKYVLCDRHWFSTIAFQGYGRGISLQTIESAISLSVGTLLPALTVVVDLPVLIARQRMEDRAKQSPIQESDKFEDEAQVFQEKVRAGFVTLAQASRAPSVILDGKKSSEVMLQELLGFFAL